MPMTMRYATGEVTCREHPAHARAALAGDENARAELVKALLARWLVSNPSTEITEFVRMVAYSAVGAVLERTSAVDQLALLWERGVEQEQGGPDGV